eukprot:13423398-Heterocapsa_arctica.AAC.1
MAAYAPLAFWLFGCKRLSTSLRMSFVRSLILSRLTFNAHVRHLQPRELCVLNNPYVRALRRIARE